MVLLKTVDTNLLMKNVTTFELRTGPILLIFFFPDHEAYFSPLSQVICETFNAYAQEEMRIQFDTHEFFPT